MYTSYLNTQPFNINVCHKNTVNLNVSPSHNPPPKISINIYSIIVFQGAIWFGFKMPKNELY